MQTIKTINVEKELDRFFKSVIKESRKNLKSKGINASGNLSRTMDYNINVGENSIDADLLMAKMPGQNISYGEFVNYGVKGTESGRSLKGYRYTDKKPPVRFLKTWVKQKTGKFRQRNQDSIAYAIQNTIYKRGIKPTEFFSKPFEKAFATLPDEIVEAYGLDVEDFMEFVLND